MSQSHLQTVSENQHIETPDWKLTPSDVSEAAEENAENLTRLERMLTRAQGFTLGFARVNVPTQRAELVKQIRERVEPKGIQIIEIDLREPVEDLLAELVRQLSDKMPHDTRRFAVFVYGLEHSIPSSETYHPPLAVINYKRENFRNAIPVPLVLWVPEYALQAIMEGAPDFWAWRSGLFEFETPKETVETHWLQIEPERDLLELSNMTAEEKRNRIQLLSGLLAEYEGREDADSTEIARIRLDLLDRIGYLYSHLGEYTPALEYHQRVLKMMQGSNSKAGMTVPLHNIGSIHLLRGDYKTALQHYKKALEIGKEIDDYEAVVHSLHHIGIIHQVRGNYEAALEIHKNSMKIIRQISTVKTINASLHHLAWISLYHITWIHQVRGNYEVALTESENLRQFAQELGNHESEAVSLHQIGMIHYARGDHQRAFEAYEKSLKIFTDIGSRAHVAKSLNEIGRVHQARGDYQAGILHYNKSLKISEELGNSADVAASHGQLGQVLTQIGHYPEAFEHLYAAYVTFLEMESADTQIAIYLLKTLRTQWGAENFDAAWQDATGETVPKTLT